MSGRKHTAIKRPRRKNFTTLATASAFRSIPESLEERVLPATISWVGDISSSWSANVGGNTNWSGDSLPVDGDSLSFTGTATGSPHNDTTANNSYSLAFASAGYTITGNSIRLDNAGTDITQIAGPNLVQSALQLDASSVDVQAGVLDLAGSLTGTAGLTKLGSGTLILTGPASFTGGTVVQSGALQVDGDY
ncbi:MAG: autotransporter-associated beta strand repeat-containing protein, partial [Planctomycetaceae bacterium]